MRGKPRGIYKTKIKPPKNPKTPVDFLLKYRVENRLTYVELSKRITISDALIKGFVYGVNNVSPRAAIKIAKLVKKDQKLFLTWTLKQMGAWNNKWEIIEKTERTQNEIHTKPE